MKILITGGAGFIGSFLTQKLIDQGANITIIDNQSTIGGIPFFNKNARCINDSIVNPKIFKKIKNDNFDVVIHLAAQSAGEPAYDDPFHDINTNVYGTYLTANYANSINAKQFIYASSVAVYGNVKGVINEKKIPNPDSIYGVSKLAGENFTKQLFKKTKTKYSVLRVFNTYGPGENINYTKKGMVSIYLNYLWKNKAILVKGNLSRYRDFTFIDDCVNGFLMCVNNNKAYSQTFDLSTGTKTLVKDLIKKQIDLYGKKPNYPVKILNQTPGDSHGFHASGYKIKKILNWKPQFSLEQGLKEYISWLKILPKVSNLTEYHPLKLNNLEIK